MMSNWDFKTCPVIQDLLGAHKLSWAMVVCNAVSVKEVTNTPVQNDTPSCIRFEFWCSVCRIKISGKDRFGMHLAGRDHAKHCLYRLSVLYHCEICNVDLPSEDALFEHLAFQADHYRKSSRWECRCSCGEIFVNQETYFKHYCNDCELIKNQDAFEQ